MKRFAKIGGEMVSLTAVEGLAEAVWPDGRHAVIAIPDPKKGERLVLVTDRHDAEVAPLAAYARTNGAPELAVPSKIVKVDGGPGAGHRQDRLRRHPGDGGDGSGGRLIRSTVASAAAPGNRCNPRFPKRNLGRINDSLTSSS